MNLKIYNKISLSKLSTIKIGGEARFFTVPENLEQLMESLEFAKKSSLKPFIFGSAANILFPDKPSDDTLFITLRKLNNLEIKENEISFDAGFPVSLIPFSGLLSLYFLYLLPGTIGAATYMNVKYDKYEIGSYISKIIFIDLNDLEIKEIDAANACFSYKSSIFQRQNWIILKVFFPVNNLESSMNNFFISEIEKKLNTIKKISKNSIKIESDLKKFYRLFNLNNMRKSLITKIDEKILNEFNKIEDYRIAKKHFSYPSCGSIFKNNYSYGIATGALIDKLGLKGFRHNDAQIAPYHGNIIINLGRAKSSDVLYIIKIVQDKINENFGFIPEPEIVIL